jgi:transglutaminase-like putative cysteine protease
VKLIDAQSVTAAASVALSALLSGHAFADVGQRLPHISEVRDEVRVAKGPLAYAAVRKLWMQWDQGDPSDVEEALDELAADATLSNATRSYAALLEAYARRRRGDLDGARARIARLGFIDRWLVVGPFDNEGKGGLSQEFGPETDRSQPVSIARGYDGKERPVRWRPAPSGASPYGWFDTGAFLRPTAKICAYVTTFVRDARMGTQSHARPSTRPISIWTGAAGALKVFWNGTEVLRDEKYRDLDSDRFATGVTLEEGWNRLLVKICGDDNAPILSLRLADPNGAPDPHLEVDSNPVIPHEGTVQTPKAPASALSRMGPEGPVQAFERLIKSNEPAMLEGYARYLAVTQSDDPAEHRARELARRAANGAPTVARMLLAAELAEGRNQRATWIEKAEALSNKGATVREKTDVLLARAAHIRSGTNWRDAVPIYDKVLAIDADNVSATLARFELYTAAGLRETALAFLQQALGRRPGSVALVHAIVGALREEDRTTEADEMAERYASLRFDDPAFAKGHLELALARRDARDANRWIDRLIATNPDSAAAFSVAARAYEALGDRPRVVAMYKRALDLAPEDTDVLRALADMYATPLAGAPVQRDEQIKLLRQIVLLLPQSKDVREYLAHLEPSKPRADEMYARPSTEFLKLRGAPSDGYNRRTLVDLTSTTVFPNGLASRFHQIVFQPLTDSAAAEAREYAFGFDADTEAVQLRGAKVYRANGHVDEAIESGEGPTDNPALATYSSAKAFYVHFPRLNPGDVVELLYRVEDVAQRNAFADYFGEVNYMQSSEPVARAEYVLLTPKSRTFYFNKPNIAGITQTVEDTTDRRIYHFVALNVPAIQPEALQPPYGEILGHVHVSTYKSWDEMARWYWGLVKDQFVADDEVRRRVREATAGLKDDRAKVRAVYDFVVQKTRYVALEFGIHGFKPYRCAQIFARGFGDCKDKATLIVTMLKELGIGATIVIVRTGLKGDFELAPASLAPFDHAIAYVPSLDLYLDGTAEYTGSTELPAMDRGALALQINEGHAKLVHLPDPPASESVSSRKLEATVLADGSALIDWNVDVTGVSASFWRQRYHADVSRTRRVQEDLGTDIPGLEVSQVNATDLEDVERNPSLRIRGKAREFARKEGDSLSAPTGPRDHMVRDFAPLSHRTLDVRLHAQSITATDWTLRLPQGAHVTSAPRPATVDGAFGRVTIEVEQGPSVIHVKTTEILGRTRVAASEYPAFRAWCENADRALGQRVVFSR